MTVQERIAKVRLFNVKPDFSTLTDGERAALLYAVSASKIMTAIYLDQAYEGNRQIVEKLMRSQDAESQDLLTYFGIQGCPWDSYNHDEPFIPGVGPKPKFGSFYPPDLTKEEWEAWLKTHPHDRDAFESNYTVIVRPWFDPKLARNDLAAFPYSWAYAEYLEEAANKLCAAASCLPEGALKSFLKARAEAFLSNDYFESDCLWVDTNGNPFEVTIGPYEVYFDELLGLKASFESFIALPDKAATEALTKFSPHVPDFDKILAGEFGFKPKGSAIPLEVVADVHRGGEAAFGNGFVAYNLPNNRKVHELKGSKKVFSATMMRAKFDTLAYPVAERVLSPNDLNHMKFENRLLFVLGHELAHGLGPTTVKDGDREVPFETKLGDLHSALEEAKADMLGVRLLVFFRERGLISEEILQGVVVTQAATFAQQCRRGFNEAHAKGNLIEYNWLKRADAIRYDEKTGTFDIHYERALDAMMRLATEFLNLQKAGDYARAKAFVEEWTKIPPEAAVIANRLADLPKAVHPVYDLSEL